MTISCTPASGTIFPVGTTTVTCTASDPELNTTTGSFTVTVTLSLGDFSLSPIAPITVSVGGSASSSVTVNSVNSFSQAVTLSVSGSPSGVSTSLSPNPVTPPAGGSASSTLGLTLSSFVTPGTFTLTIMGTAGSLSHSISATVTVLASPSAVSTVIGELLTAGCIDNAGIANALTAKLAAAQKRHHCRQPEDGHQYPERVHPPGSGAEWKTYPRLLHGGRSDL